MGVGNKILGVVLRLAGLELKTRFWELCINLARMGVENEIL